MSLINQVLSDLEKRGAHAGTRVQAVHPVHLEETRWKWRLPALILLAMLVLAGMLAGLRHQPASIAGGKEPGKPAGQPALPAAGSDIPAAVTSMQTVGQLTQPPGKQEHRAERFNMRMSLELHALPLPAKQPQAQDHRMDEAHNNNIAHPGNSVEQSKPALAGIAQQPGMVATLPAAPTRSQQGDMIVPADLPTVGIDKKVRQITIQQQAENEYRKANGLMQRGRNEEAIAGYRAALQLDAAHDPARQALVGLLLESKQEAEAEQVLQAGLDRNPKNSSFAILLARLQVDRKALPQALQTLQVSLPFADQRADYQAFLAAVLQRMDRHKEAIEHYRQALRLSPGSALWLMGLGISLKAEKRTDEARLTFRQALDAPGLSNDLREFVKVQLQELHL